MALKAFAWIPDFILKGETMTEDQRKMLTEEVLGECWHEWRDAIPGASMDDAHTVCTKCKIEDWTFGAIRQRTFTTWQDMGDLYRKLQELGLWNEFLQWCYTTYEEGDIMCNDDDGWYYSTYFACWLISPDRCETVAQFWESRKEKG